MSATVVDVAAHSVRSRTVRGFGILEVVISGAMLVAGLAAVTQFMGTSSTMQIRERHRVTAVQVGEQTMERLLVLFPEHADLTNGVHTGTTFTEAGEPGPGPFQVRWTVAFADPLPNSRRITVDVSWIDGGVTRTLSLQTIRS